MKKNYLLLSLLLASRFCMAQLPGSGNSLVFDKVDDYITVPHSPSLVMTNAITVEAWISVSGYLDNGVIACKTVNNTTFGAGYALTAFTNDGNVFNLNFRVANATTNATAFVNGNSIQVLRNNNWVHIAATFDGSVARIYVNGIQSGNTPAAATPFSISDANYPFVIGDVNAATNNNNKFFGKIDELRVWNTVRTPNEIRANICRKISGTAPNLQAYYRFDQTTGTTLPDLTANANNGTVTGGPVWQTSGASIGDASASNYAGAASAVSLNNPIRTDAFTASLTTGNADGIHVFCVNQAPNNVSGTTGVGGNSSYFGVLVANTSTAAIPAYTATYNYSGIFGSTTETDLRLYKRTNNAATTWADAAATINTTANTLTCTGQNTEYIVGSAGVILPLKLLAFTGIKQPGYNLLQWTTSNETNTRLFTIESSTDGQIFKTLGVVNAAGSGSNGYQYKDAGNVATSFYRLKITDNDNRFTYSPIVKISASHSPLKIYPNPTTQYITISGITPGGTVQILDMPGKVLLQIKITANTQVVDVSKLAKGSYTLQYNDGKRGVAEKLLVW